MRRSSVVALFAGVGLLASPAPAGACSCDGSLMVIPPNGSSGVPLNPRILVREHYLANRDGLGVMRVGDTTPVPATVAVSTRRNGRERLSIATPDQDLEPGTSYQVVMTVSGALVTLATFTTGTERDTEPPAFAGIQELRLETMAIEEVGYGSSCTESDDGWHGRLRPLLAGVPEDAAYLQLELFRPSNTGDPIDVITDWSLAYIESTSCAVRPPPLEPGAGWCARAVAYDLAGNAAGGERIACADVIHCARMYDDFSFDRIEPCDERKSGCSAGGASSPLAFGAALFLLYRVRRRPPTLAAREPGVTTARCTALLIVGEAVQPANVDASLPP